MLTSAFIFGTILGIRRGLQFRPLFQFLRNSYARNMKTPSFKTIVLIQLPELILTFLTLPFFVYSSKIYLGCATIFGGLTLIWSGYRETQSQDNFLNPDLSNKYQKNLTWKKMLLYELKSPLLYINAILLNAPLLRLLDDNGTFYIAPIVFIAIKVAIEAGIHWLELLMTAKGTQNSIQQTVQNNTPEPEQAITFFKKLGKIIGLLKLRLFLKKFFHFRTNKKSSQNANSGKTGNKIQTTKSNKTSKTDKVSKESKTDRIEIEVKSEKTRRKKKKSEENPKGTTDSVENSEEPEQYDDSSKQSQSTIEAELINSIPKAGFILFLQRFLSVLLFLMGIILTIAGIVQLFPSAS